jgi:hypothetical protein
VRVKLTFTHPCPYLPVGDAAERQSVSVRKPHPLASIAAAVFLFAVLAAVGILVRDVFSRDNEDYDMQVLSRDLLAFEGAPGDPSTAVDLQPCTGEGSVPAAAQRQYTVPGPVDAVRQKVVAEATSLGWSTRPPPVDPNVLAQPIDIFGKGDRELWVRVTEVGNTRVEVSLEVTGGQPC